MNQARPIHRCLVAMGSFLCIAIVAGCSSGSVRRPRLRPTNYAVVIAEYKAETVLSPVPSSAPDVVRWNRALPAESGVQAGVSGHGRDAISIAFADERDARRQVSDLLVVPEDVR